MERALNKSTEAAKQPHKVRSNSVFKRMFKSSLKTSRLVPKLILIGTLIAFGSSITKGQSTTVSSSSSINGTGVKPSIGNEIESNYRTIDTKADGRVVKYVIYTDGRVLGLFPGKENGDRILVTSPGPILADCVTSNGEYYGVSKTGIAIITLDGAFIYEFSKIFSDEIVLSDAPKLVPTADGSVLLSDKNLTDKDAGVYAVLKLTMKNGKLNLSVLSGDRLVTMER